MANNNNENNNSREHNSEARSLKGQLQVVGLDDPITDESIADFGTHQPQLGTKFQSKKDGLHNCSEKLNQKQKNRHEISDSKRQQQLEQQKKFIQEVVSDFTIVRSHSIPDEDIDVEHNLGLGSTDENESSSQGLEQALVSSQLGKSYNINRLKTLDDGNGNGCHDPQVERLCPPASYLKGDNSFSFQQPDSEVIDQFQLARRKTRRQYEEDGKIAQKYCT